MGGDQRPYQGCYLRHKPGVPGVFLCPTDSTGGADGPQALLLFQFLLQVLLLHLQVPDGLHGQLQIPLRLPFGSLQLGTQLLLLLQGDLQLHREGGVS